jgi:hypothetical protein
MIPKIISLPITKQRFTTLGDWYEEEPGKFVITTSEMSDWRHEFLVLIHELTEWAICQAMGVSAANCDKFDSAWEREIEAGTKPLWAEAGFDKKCPYYRGHVWGARMERLFCYLLGCKWKDYTSACDDLIVEYRMNKEVPCDIST